MVFLVAHFDPNMGLWEGEGGTKAIIEWFHAQIDLKISFGGGIFSRVPRHSGSSLFPKKQAAKVLIYILRDMKRKWVGNLTVNTKSEFSNLL